MIRDFIFLGIALLLFVLWGLPNVRAALMLLLPRRIRCEFEGPREIHAEDFMPETQTIIGELEKLGFEPLGVKVEWRPGKQVAELAFGCASRKCFASIHGYDDDAPHFYFYTPFEDEAVVLTSDVAMNAVRTSAFAHYGVADKTPAELLELHAKNVARMCKEGHEPIAAFDRKARVQATEAYYRNPGSKTLEHGILLRSLSSAGTSLGLLCLAVALLAWRFVKD